jgi:predicted GNAT family N-acyltransferase
LAYCEGMRLVELDRLSEPYWEELVAGESEPFGHVGEDLVWREKTQNIGLREDDGRLVAAAGVVLADVKVAGEPPFQVAGLGGLIVTRSERGRGLGPRLFQRLLELAGELEVGRAMLFCLPELMALYGRYGFVPVDAPVWADQPTGRIEMPMPAMWKALRPDTSWPSGGVELLGEPF